MHSHTDAHILRNVSKLHVSTRQEAVTWPVCRLSALPFKTLQRVRCVLSLSDNDKLTMTPNLAACSKNEDSIVKTRFSFAERATMQQKNSVNALQNYCNFQILKPDKKRGEINNNMQCRYSIVQRFLTWFWQFYKDQVCWKKIHSALTLNTDSNTYAWIPQNLLKTCLAKWHFIKLYFCHLKKNKKLGQYFLDN